MAKSRFAKDEKLVDLWRYGLGGSSKKQREFAEPVKGVIVKV